jgi:intracellular sulfur oxidation DsrE/DsrF family protein
MRRTPLALLALTFSLAATAGPDRFHAGTVIAGYGKVASVTDATRIPAKAKFKVAFDVSEPAEQGSVNRHLDSAARLLNMHAEAGLAASRTRIAIVVHGRAAMDLVNDERYGASNANAGLIAALVASGVSIELCGQTAAYYDIDAADLLPGVTMSLSAMTAHALLQQQGYTLNPF